jgi:ZIP family zinc transporter
MPRAALCSKRLPRAFARKGGVDVLFALSVATLAGLSTGLGGLVVAVLGRPGARLMAFSLGFAGGVMTAVSLSDMLPHAVETYSDAVAAPVAALWAASLCALGMAAARLLAQCLPESVRADASGALRSALVTALALLLHNLPEGVLTLFAGYADPRMGVRLALAIALHNIPEGIAIAVPLYYATGSRWKGAVGALVSGLAEPVGALAAFWLLRGLLTPLFLNGVIAFVAGVMLWVCAAELLPQSFAYGRHGCAVGGICSGILVMSVGLYLV